MGPQGPDQHPWNVRCIHATTLARVALVLLSRNWPSTRSTTCTVFFGLAKRVSVLQRKSAAGAARRGLPCSPRDSTLHRCHDAGTCGAGLTLQKLTLHKLGHLHGSFGLAGRVNQLPRKPAAGAARRRLPWAPRVQISTLGTCAASMPRRLHVWRWPYPPETGFAQGRPRYLWPCRARQPTATQARGWRCTSGASLGPQGPNHHPWNVRSIDATTLARVTLALPSRNCPCTRSATWRVPFWSCRACQPTATQASGWRCTSGAALGPQGPDQHPWNVRCLDATTLARVALALPSRNWPCTRSATCTVPFWSCRARQPTATQASGWRCTLGAALGPQGTDQHP